jgi:hypothetical protein
MQNEKDRKRVTGYSISSSEDQLAKISEEMKIKEGGKNFKPVTPAEINDQLSSIFDDSQKKEGGLQFTASHDIGAPLISFKRKSIERIGGHDQKLKDDSRLDEITETGAWYHSGAGNGKYEASIPLEISRLEENRWLPEICDGGSSSFMLNISGSTDQTKAFSAEISTIKPVCLNGMKSEIIVGSSNAVKHRNTKGLNIRELLIEAIRRASSYYHKFNMVSDQLRASEVTLEKLGVFFLSAVNNKIINGGNQTEIFNYFMDSQINKNNPQFDSWFDVSDLSGYRLYQACTLWGERQNALEKRNKIASGIWWSLADASILPLPETCVYPSYFNAVKNNMKSDIIDVEIAETVPAV